jgi:hypothetical protein
MVEGSLYRLNVRLTLSGLGEQIMNKALIWMYQWRGKIK